MLFLLFSVITDAVDKLLIGTAEAAGVGEIRVKAVYCRVDLLEAATVAVVGWCDAVMYAVTAQRRGGAKRQYH